MNNILKNGYSSLACEQRRGFANNWLYGEASSEKGIAFNLALYERGGKIVVYMKGSQNPLQRNKYSS